MIRNVEAPPDLGERDPDLVAVLEAAGRVQELVPTAVVVGGAAAALFARHRHSHDADHDVADLRDRFEMVLEALEEEPGWRTNRLVPGTVILGDLDGVEIGVRQMVRRRPLEVTRLRLPSGREPQVPTAAETLRMKGFLVVRRNQTRDFLDVAALAETVGVADAGDVLRHIDEYYADQVHSHDGVASQLVRQLGAPRPVDAAVTRQLARYRRLRTRWHQWSTVVDVCREVAARMVEVP